MGNAHSRDGQRTCPCPYKFNRLSFDFRIAMKKIFTLAPRFNPFTCALALLALLACGGNVLAQETGTPVAPEEQQENRRDNTELLQALNLTPEQKDQIKLLRQQTIAEGRAVTFRLRRARRALDAAIYSAAADEALIEARARDLAEAQTAQVRLRALTELKIRRVLTTEQLQTFLQLRQRARAQQRLRRQQQLPGGDMRPMRERP